ncbi:hypothetical protein [Haloquadratum walsbyi]|uniref:hypothetical protein n=1 Tax=Haloquadratum walsbyi TaxID=293091 RepID=UPI0015F58659|nr:hypothetical protein [Haloquadratum walsbyi]
MTMNQNDGEKEPLAPESLNQQALIGLILSVIIGVGGLFALPAIQVLFQLQFFPAFTIVLVIELIATAGVVISMFRLHREQHFG